MKHILVRRGKKIVDHLVRFGLLDFPVFLIAGRLHEGLMDEFAHRTPCFSIWHHQYMITSRDQIGDERWWPVAENGTVPVEQYFVELLIRHDERGVHEALQREDASMFLGPFRHPVILLVRLLWYILHSHHI